MKKQILFVDDEPNLLGGLRRALFHVSSQWDMYFIPGGVEAIRLLREKKIIPDIIVSDYLMPEMNGVEFLQEAVKVVPRSVRIILSGQTDAQYLEPSLRVTHRFLSKPRSTEEIKSTIQNACEFIDALTECGSVHVSSFSDRLPCSKVAYDRVLALTNDARPGVEDELIKVVEKDVALFATLLHLVNGGYLGSFSASSNPVDGLNALGTARFNSLLRTSKLLQPIANDSFENVSVGDLCSYSYRVASYARHIALLEGEQQEAVEASFAAGLLHQIGILVFLGAYCDNLGEISSNLHSAPTGKAILPGNLRCYSPGGLMCELGRHFLTLWGISNAVMDAVQFHTSPKDSPSQKFGPIAVLHLARLFESERRNDLCASELYQLDTEYLKRIGKLEQVPFWREACAKLNLEEDIK